MRIFSWLAIPICRRLKQIRLAIEASRINRSPISQRVNYLNADESNDKPVVSIGAVSWQWCTYVHVHTRHDCKSCATYCWLIVESSLIPLCCTIPRRLANRSYASKQVPVFEARLIIQTSVYYAWPRHLIKFHSPNDKRVVTFQNLEEFLARWLSFGRRRSINLLPRTSRIFCPKIAIFSQF